jgi:hypothetical protein
MGYQVTRPDTDQLKFTSSKTGDWVLEDYLQAAELGNKTLSELLLEVWNADGTLRTFTTNTALDAAVAQAGTHSNNAFLWSFDAGAHKVAASNSAIAAASSAALATSNGATQVALAATQAAAALVSATAASNIVLGVSTTLPAIRPSLNLDFTNSRSVDPRITFTRSSTATRINHLGVLETVAANIPRLDYDPVTLACKGLLIEEARTNTIRNSKNTGATVGVVGSGGVIPTYWAVTGSPGTVVREVIGTGVIDGAEYIDLRLSGTTSTTNFGYAFEPSTGGVSGTIGQTWTEGVSVALIGGSLSNVGYIKLQLTERDGAGAGLASYGVTDVKSLLTPSLSRHVITYALVNAGTTQVQPNILVGWTSTGVAVDITLRLSAPQLEQGSFATSYIPTSGSQVTRAADVAKMDGANFTPWYKGTEGTFVLTASAGYVIGSGSACGLVVGNGTSTTYLTLFTSKSNGKPGVYSQLSATTQGSTSSASSVASGTMYVSAAAYKTDDFAVSVNGATAAADFTGSTLETASPAIDRLILGSGWDAASSTLNGHIRNVSYYPKRLTNLEIQSLSA